MKPITTETSHKLTNRPTDISSIAFVNGQTLEKNLPAASFLLASSKKPSTEKKLDQILPVSIVIKSESGA